MAVRASFSKRNFNFAFTARTSRGPMESKSSWYIILSDDQSDSGTGIGECGPLPGLSLDAIPDFELQLAGIVNEIDSSGKTTLKLLETVSELVPQIFPSIRFGLETALLDLYRGGAKVIYDNDFKRGKPIPINGLIWMGDTNFMMDQVRQKVEQGYRCLKLKIGGLDFQAECGILSKIRSQFGNEITLRLDANGSFDPDDAIRKLEMLSKFDIHSIEQPIAPGNEVQMQLLCRNSPIPVALDEELISHQDRSSKEALLSGIRPQYIILKPTLHGGFGGCTAWIDIAKKMGIGWWVTSALESNIGLNAICQFTAGLNTSLPQGLGTGSIYTDNIPSPLTVANGQIHYDQQLSWGKL